MRTIIRAGRRAGIGAALEALRKDAQFAHEVGVLTDSRRAFRDESGSRQPHMEDLDEFVV
jgi:hypothetical protein